MTAARYCAVGVRVLRRFKLQWKEQGAPVGESRGIETARSLQIGYYPAKSQSAYRGEQFV
jgi:hypothetical protein